MKHISFYVAGILAGSLGVSSISSAAILKHGKKVMANKTRSGLARHASRHFPTDHNVAVDVNHASVQQLQQLKGIGKKRAELIIAYRRQHGNFSAIGQLKSVKGFSQARIDRLQKDNAGKIKL